MQINFIDLQTDYIDYHTDVYKLSVQLLYLCDRHFQFFIFSLNVSKQTFFTFQEFFPKGIFQKWSVKSVLKGTFHIFHKKVHQKFGSLK